MDNIAIIGMGSLYPDYVNNENFWDKIMGGEAFTAPFDYKGRKIERGRMPAENARDFFSRHFSKEEYDEMDKLGDLFKWTNFIVKEALKDSGYLSKKEKLGRTGIILGHFGVPAIEYQSIFHKIVHVVSEKSVQMVLGRDEFKYQYTPAGVYEPQGLLLDTGVAAYAADKFSLKGPILNINSACSSVVYSMKVAIMYLLQGKADMMLAGATCYNQLEGSGTEMLSLLGIATEPGDCRPFDRQSKGTTGGSGAGVFMLKRLEDAVRDDDKILGVIEGIGWSNDGGDAAILAPASTGQFMSYEDAYRRGLSPEVDYIECHATGTMAGDWVEIDSISKFFRKKGIDPYLGALKGNTSHFFTASTHAAISKTLRSMETGIIPQSIRIENSLDDRVLTENTPWIQKGEIKRAAVNSFGFGGADSHVVLREYNKKYENEKSPKRSPIAQRSKLAVVGLGSYLGEMKSADEYLCTMLDHREVVTDVTRVRWNVSQDDPATLAALDIDAIPRGAYIYDFEFDYLKYRFPAMGDEYLLRKDFLLLKTAEEALNDAGITKGSHPDTAVLVNCIMDYSELNFSETLTLYESLERAVRSSWPHFTDEQVLKVMEILQEKQDIRETTNSVTGMMPNIKASRISAQWGFHGPSFAITANETAFARSLELAQFMLSEDMVSTVVIGTVEFTGGMENLIAQKILKRADNFFKYGLVEGASVVILKKLEKAEEDSDYIYSVVDSVAVGQLSDGEDLPARLETSLAASLKSSGVGDNEIGYIEMPHTASPEIKDSFNGLLNGKLGKYIGSDNLVQDTTERYMGVSFCLSGATAFVKNVLQIADGIKFRDSERQEYLWRGKKTALVNSFDADGMGAHIVLSEYTGKTGVTNKMKTDKFLVPIFAGTKEAMAEKLEKLLGTKQKLEAIFKELWTSLEERGEGDRVLCLIANDRETLNGEIKKSLEQVSEFFQRDFVWESDTGSYLGTPQKDTEIICLCPSGDIADKSGFFEILSHFPDLRGGYLELVNSGHFDGILALDDVTKLGAVKAGINILAQRLFVTPDKFLKAEKAFSDEKALIANYISPDAADSSETFNKSKGGNSVFVGLSSDFSVLESEYAQILAGGELRISLYPEQYKPEEHYLRLLAKLVSHGIYTRDITEIFTFDIHDKPGFVRTVNMGLQDYAKIVFASSEDSWKRVMALAPSKTAEPSAAVIETTAVEPKEEIAPAETKAASSPVPAAPPSPAVPAKTDSSALVPTKTPEQGQGKIAAQNVSGTSNPTALAALRQAAKNRARAYQMYLNSEKWVLESMAGHIIAGAAVDVQYPRIMNYQPDSAAEKISPIQEAESVITAEIAVEAKAAVEPERAVNAEVPEDVEKTLAVAEPEKPAKKDCLWDLDDLIEMNKNSMASVLGPRYANVDKYPVRARLPLPPFLFMSRVTKINAEYGQMVKGSSIEIEYDITDDCILMIGDHISFMCLTESAQIGIFLMAYIGIDDMSDGTLRFRVVDSNVTIHNRLPVLGETFRGVYEITSMFKAGQTTLVTASYKGYVGDMHMLSISTIGGFFTDEDLASTKGVIDLPGKKPLKITPAENKITYEYANPKTVYNDTEMKAFYTGEYQKYIPEINAELLKKINDMPSLTPKLQLVDRILGMSYDGGKFGLGDIVAEFDIHEDYWAFDIHFLNDPVFPASLLMEGVNQLGILYLIISGKITRARPGHIYPLKNKLIKSSFRGQVRQKKSTVTYKIDIKEIFENEERFYFVYDVDVFWDGVNVVRTENASICMD